MGPTSGKARAVMVQRKRILCLVLLKHTEVPGFRYLRLNDYDGRVRQDLIASNPRRHHRGGTARQREKNLTVDVWYMTRHVDARLWLRGKL